MFQVAKVANNGTLTAENRTEIPIPIAIGTIWIMIVMMKADLMKPSRVFKEAGVLFLKRNTGK